ncbi:cytochrome P450 2M1-like isoform X2 [Anguilla rostrata]|uniref:cytochrome P450 2M1-like isoform X2 n=1 Tax=Anguilla rostrata TaxID=7938 RepID=UPI0030CF3685
MDFLSLLSNNFLSILMVLIVLALFWKSRGKESSTARLPPGPSPVPILGNIFQVDLKQPYKSYLEFSEKYGSVFTVWFGPKPVVVLSGYQTIKEALLNQGEEFSGRAIYPVLLQATKGYGVLASSGSRWKDLRRFSLMTLKNFGMGRRGIEERVQEEARFLVKAFSEYGDSLFNPHHLLCNAVSNVICSIVFGKRFEYDEQQFKFLQQSIDAYFHFLSSSKGQFFNMFPRLAWYLPGPHHEVFQHLEKVRNYIEQEAKQRLSHLDINSPQDYIEAFLVRMLEQEHKPGSEFHFDNLVSSIWNLFSAGTETTSSTLRHGLLLMMKYPHVQERIQKEIDEVVGSSRSPSVQDRQNMPYTDAVIHEVQRSMDLTPTSVPHKTMRDTEFKGYFLPERTSWMRTEASRRMTRSWHLDWGNGSVSGRGWPGWSSSSSSPPSSSDSPSERRSPRRRSTPTLRAAASDDCHAPTAAMRSSENKPDARVSLLNTILILAAQRISLTPGLIMASLISLAQLWSSCWKMAMTVSRGNQLD